jgi:hypothetical protein
MTESIFDGGDDGIAWPSYVDFLFAFSFILVLSLGYMAFVSVSGVEDEVFQREAISGRSALEKMGIKPNINSERKTIEIPLNKFISFEKGCPSKPICPKELSEDEQKSLRGLAGLFSTEFRAARVISLRGQADRDKGSDDFVNFRVGNDRALAVYKVFFHCAAACGLTDATGSLRKIQLANAGDTLAEVAGASRQDRTVTIILYYSSK